MGPQYERKKTYFGAHMITVFKTNSNYTSGLVCDGTLFSNEDAIIVMA
jgi:hypothetical protein